MYRCADTYVAPSSCEGFNLPVLESMASGTPVIVTNGTSTDDFTTRAFARYINSQKKEKPYRLMEPDANSLVKEMEFVVKDFKKNSKWLSKAGKEAAKFAHANYSWENVVDKLLCRLSDYFPELYLKTDIYC
jgi:glycosyltransferase involved in cell wall biosynthesis